MTVSDHKVLNQNNDGWLRVHCLTPYLHIL